MPASKRSFGKTIAEGRLLLRRRVLLAERKHAEPAIIVLQASLAERFGPSLLERVFDRLRLTHDDSRGDQRDAERIGQAMLLQIGQPRDQQACGDDRKRIGVEEISLFEMASHA